MEKHHSCLVTKAIVEYFQENRPDSTLGLFDNLGPEIEGLANPQEFLTEGHNWVSSDVAIKMFENARRLSGDEQIAYKIGFESVVRKKFGYAQRIFMFVFGNPLRAMKKAQAMNDKFNKNKVIEIFSPERRKMIIRLHWLHHIPSSKDFCLINQGIYSAMPTIWNLPPGTIRETKCFFQGDEYCEYHGAWQEKSFLKKTFQKFFRPWRLVKDTIEELERDKELLRQKFDEVHHLNLQLKEKIDQLMSLPESCVTALSIVDLKGLLQVTLRILINFAKLDRAGIFLLDDEGKFLELHTGVGIDPVLAEKVQGYKIPVTKVDNIIARVAINGIPVIIPDVAHSRLNRDNLLIKFFQPQAFILAPITVRGKVLGVIMADRTHPHATVTEQDKDFVVNFANQIAIALDNAILHRKLEISERRYKEMVENAHEGIWIIDERGIIKFVNRRLLEITGQKNLEGSKVFGLFSRDDRRLLGNILSRNRRGQVVQQELEISSQDRGLVPVILSSVPLTENGQFLGAFAMVSDISELKKMERQLLKQQKMEAIVTLTEGICRYFNDVLVNIMLLNGMLLSETDPSQPAYNDLKQIEQEVQRGAELSQQLVAMGDASSFEPKPLDPNTLIDKTIKLFLLSHQEIIFSKNLALNLPAVEGDQGQLEQILVNLMLLARSTMSGPQEVRIATEEVALREDFCRAYGRLPGRYVYISLNYPGKVVEEQAKAGIYEPVLTTREISPDRGLGLISVYAMIKNHRGIIELDSEAGQGSTFHIYLPVTPKAVTAEQRPAAAFVRGSGTLLLVDDDETVRSLGTRMLERLGYQVIPAESGRHALAIYRTQKDRIDLVILDMIMPEMSGRETYQQLQTIDPQVKVLLYSGHSMDEDVHLVLEKGALGFIQKPYRIANLSQKIAEFLSKPPAVPRSLPISRESGSAMPLKRVGRR